MSWLRYTHLKGQVGDDAGHSEAHQQQVGKDEGSGGVDNLLDLLARAAGLTRLSAGQQATIIRLLLSLFFFLFLLCVFSPSPLDAFVVLVLALLEPPVHDVANHRRGDQTQQLEHTKDGSVDAHWGTDSSAELQ